MKAVNNFLKRILASILAVAIMAVSIFPVYADVVVTEFSKEFLIDIYSVSSGKYTGMFRYKDAQLYVEVQSIMGMAEFVNYEEKSDGGMEIKRGGFSEVYFEPHEVVKADDFIWYVPFEKAMNELIITCCYDPETNELFVHPLEDDIYELRQITEDLMKHRIYKMLDWRKANILNVEQSAFVAKIIDYRRNWEKIPAIITGMADYEKIDYAIKKILTPNADNYHHCDDILELVNAYLKFKGNVVPDAMRTQQGVIEMIDGLKLGNEATEYIKVLDMAGKYSELIFGTLSKANMVVQSEDVLDLILFSESVKEANVNLINGFNLISPHAIDTNQHLNLAIQENLALYEGDVKAFIAGITRQLADGTMKLATTVGTDLFLGMWIDLANYITDELRGTQQQVDGILNAWANLTIQDACRRPFAVQQKRYGKANSYVESSDALKCMRDIALVHMYAALYAQLGFGDEVDDNDNVIRDINLEIEKLMKYSELEFNLAHQVKDSKDKIVSSVYASVVPVEITWKNDFRNMNAGIGLDVDSQLPYGEVVFNNDSRRFEKSNGFTIMSELQADSGYRSLALIETECPVEMRIYCSENTDPAIGLAELRLSVKVNYEEIENLYSYKEFDTDGEYIRLVFEKGELKK